MNYFADRRDIGMGLLAQELDQCEPIGINGHAAIRRDMQPDSSIGANVTAALSRAWPDQVPARGMRGGLLLVTNCKRCWIRLASGSLDADS
jgi:hypothetical protein